MAVPREDFCYCCGTFVTYESVPGCERWRKVICKCNELYSTLWFDGVSLLDAKTKKRTLPRTLCDNPLSHPRYDGHSLTYTEYVISDDATADRIAARHSRLFTEGLHVAYEESWKSTIRGVKGVPIFIPKQAPCFWNDQWSDQS